ncbi:hypothetical protein ACF1GY_29760 [Streptomyces sp. NPDC014684]|uniref:hypothetical protein n=1 Tax=unclassified Streptomyces TaxID=2593676 RepID=UPI0036B7E266
MSSDFLTAIQARAIALNGTAVVPTLTGGQTVSGTPAYATRTGLWGAVDYPETCTLTTAGKATTVRMDCVAAVAQG